MTEYDCYDWISPLYLFFTPDESIQVKCEQNQICYNDMFAPIWSKLIQSNWSQGMKKIPTDICISYNYQLCAEFFCFMKQKLNFDHEVVLKI